MASDMFLMFEKSLKVAPLGETTDKENPGTKGWMEIDSFSFGGSQPVVITSGKTGAAVERVSLQDVSVTKALDNASPQLFQAAIIGAHFPKAHLVCRRAGETPVTYLTVDFTEVFVTSFGTSGAAGVPPSETLSFAYGKIELTYTPQKVAGLAGDKNPVSWDVTKNE